jgi:hypothetical protein
MYKDDVRVTFGKENGIYFESRSMSLVSSQKLLTSPIATNQKRLENFSIIVFEALINILLTRSVVTMYRDKLKLINSYLRQIDVIVRR